MQRKNSISRIFILFIAASITLILSTSSLFSQLPGYRGEMPIRIKNNSGTPITNSQIGLRINTQQLIALGLIQSSGADIRFGTDCSGSAPIPYWLEGYMNTDSTRIWVKVTSIPANDSILIYMFFGNGAATSNSSLTIFNGPHSSTDSVASGGTGSGVANAQRGFRFTANVNILVTHFGKRVPTATSRVITLFNFSTQQVLRQRTVNGPASQYTYDTLGSPIWLMQGQQYLLELFGDAANYSYYFGTSSQIGQHLTYGDMRYCNSCTQNTFPTSILTNYHYGYPDLWYYVIDNPVTPAPSHINQPPADTNTPAAPTNLTAIAGNQQATLRWNRNVEFDISRYLVYRNTSNNPGSALLIDSTSQPDTDYVATGLTNGTPYYFWVRAKDRFCSLPRISPYSIVAQVTPLAIVKNENEVPKVFALYQNFPNPFNPITNISFDIPKATFVKITIYDLTGREADVLVNEFMGAGKYVADWNAENYASGVYFYKIEAGPFTDRKKMVILK